jgi:RHS repeat-associated protein
MAAQARTVLLCLAALCLPALASVPRASLLSEKPRQGVQSLALVSHRVPAAANALIAPGIARCLCDEGRRSRSTGKERDGETGLDYFGARYMSAAQGRFGSADAPFIDQQIESAKSWNQYAYVRNNPLTYRDPDGRICIWGIGNTCDLPAPTLPPPPAPPAPVLAPNGSLAQGPQAPSSSTANGFSLTINNRQAQIPGGQTLASAGVNHQWITASNGTSAGLGTEQGVPQSDLPGVETYVVDHSGQKADSSTTYTNIDQGAALSYLQIGSKAGRWLPIANDCNTWCAAVVNNSTPRDRQVFDGVTTFMGFRTKKISNAVVYSDGSVRKTAVNK